MKVSQSVVVCVTAAAFGLLATAAFAQEATLTGTIADSTGGVLPGVTITATHSPAQRCTAVSVTLPDYVAENAWYTTGDQHNRVTFNGIYEAPYGFQVSGLYIFGDNGHATARSGVDVLNQGSSGQVSAQGRLRANGTVIPRNGLNLPPLHRVDMRLQKRFSVTQKFKIDGIFEVFNVFNRANFDPTTFQLNEQNAKYGQPNASTTTAYSPRMLQFGSRTQF